MKALNLPALALIATALAVGFEARGRPVHRDRDEATKNDDGPASRKGDEVNKDAQGRYAAVNGLRMYYEIHGTGRPLVLLHGAFGLAQVYPGLAKDRQMIAVELQGHGRTLDIDRPLSAEQMADDVAALLKELKIDQADVFGYSMGGLVALGVAIRHPEVVRKLVINGSYFGSLDDSFEPEAARQFKSLPADFALPPPLKAAYDSVGFDPKRWPTLVAKIKASGAAFKGFAPKILRRSRCPS